MYIRHVYRHVYGHVYVRMLYRHFQTPQYMLRFTSGAFDLPDRLFSAIDDAWAGVLNNPSDHKELIPEFFNSSGRAKDRFCCACPTSERPRPRPRPKGGFEG